MVVHGQSDQIRLKSPVAQREALDKFAGAEPGGPLAAYQDLYARWQAGQAELDALRSAARERAARGRVPAGSPWPRSTPSTRSRGRTRRSRPRPCKLANVEELRIAATHGAPGAHRRGLRRGRRRHDAGGCRQAHPGARGRTRRGAGVRGRAPGRGRLPAQRHRRRPRQLPGRPGHRGPGAAGRDRGPPGRAGEAGPQVRAEHRRGAASGPSTPGPGSRNCRTTPPGSKRWTPRWPAAEAELPEAGRSDQQGRARRPPRTLSARVSAELKALAMADATLVINVGARRAELGPTAPTRSPSCCSRTPAPRPARWARAPRAASSPA